jgi:hypothetical protein
MILAFHSGGFTENTIVLAAFDFSPTLFQHGAHVAIIQGHSLLVKLGVKSRLLGSNIDTLCQSNKGSSARKRIATK